MNRKGYSVVVYKFTSTICPNNQVKLSAKTTNHQGLICCPPRRLFRGFKDKIDIKHWPPIRSEQLPLTRRGLLFYLLHRQVSCETFLKHHDRIAVLDNLFETFNRY